MKFKLIIFASLFVVLAAEEKVPSGRSLFNSHDKVEKRNFFGLLPGLSVPPLLNIGSSGVSTCVSNIGLSGQCISPTDCALRNGTSDGVCASGFGRCCIVLGNCSYTSNQNCSYFVNPGYPQTCGVAGNGMCTFNIVKMNPDVKQLKLDFEEFNLSPPSLGTCGNDTFLVIGGDSSTPFPVLCGNNKGQSAYMHVANSQGPFQLGVITGGTAPFPRKWKIKVTQLTSTHPDLAPPGLLQYHTSPQGKIQSFNYNNGNGEMLNNQNYAIGFKPQVGLCSTMLTGPFDVSDSSKCAGDSLATLGNTYCGSQNPIAIMLNSTSFPIQVTTDSVNRTPNKGFGLNYMMNPCNG